MPTSSISETIEALQWEELIQLSVTEFDYLNGPTNSYSKLRLFNKPESDIEVTLYRDNHAWCPYCQKVWLWLEWKRIPYKVKKITMRCYGEKQDWYQRIVPSGMLPAISLNENIITESDDILIALEKRYGPLGIPLEDKKALELRNLERELFRAWCILLCNPILISHQRERRRKLFRLVAAKLNEEITRRDGPFIDSIKDHNDNYLPGSVDIIFIPYLERMNASLAYYHGIKIREEFKGIDEWFTALEGTKTYLGTQGDFHTHAHDLPPQMGGCWEDPSPLQKELSSDIDSGRGLGSLESSLNSQENWKEIALTRVIKHRQKLLLSNPLGEVSFDQPLRAALTSMMKSKECLPLKGSAIGLRYLRDRISVPRDMPLLSARAFRKSLERTAILDGEEHSEPISKTDRWDQNPIYFQK